MTGNESYAYDIVAGRRVTIDVDASGFSIAGGNDGNGRGEFENVREIYVWDVSAGARSIHIVLADGRVLGLGISTDKASWEAEASVQFHAATASILAQLAHTQPELQLKLGPSRKSRNLMTLIFGVIFAIALATWFIFRETSAGYAPLIVLGVMLALFVWSYWLAVPKRTLVDLFAVHIATRPKKLAP